MVSETTLLFTLFKYLKYSSWILKKRQLSNS